MKALETKNISYLKNKEGCSIDLLASIGNGCQLLHKTSPPILTWPHISNNVYISGRTDKMKIEHRLSASEYLTQIRAEITPLELRNKQLELCSGQRNLTAEEHAELRVNRLAILERFRECSTNALLSLAEQTDSLNEDLSVIGNSSEAAYQLSLTASKLSVSTAREMETHIERVAILETSFAEMLGKFEKIIQEGKTNGN